MNLKNYRLIRGTWGKVELCHRVEIAKFMFINTDIENGSESKMFHFARPFLSHFSILELTKYWNSRVKIKVEKLENLCVDSGDSTENFVWRHRKNCNTTQEKVHNGERKSAYRQRKKSMTTQEKWHDGTEKFHHYIPFNDGASTVFVKNQWKNAWTYKFSYKPFCAFFQKLRDSWSNFSFDSRIFQNAKRRLEDGNKVMKILDLSCFYFCFHQYPIGSRIYFCAKTQVFPNKKITLNVERGKPAKKRFYTKPWFLRH